VSVSRRRIRFRKIREIGGGRNGDYVSKHFERWEKLADLTSKEQDSAKLTELAHEINLVLAQRAPDLDPPLREAGQSELPAPFAESSHDCRRSG